MEKCFCVYQRNINHGVPEKIKSVIVCKNLESARHFIDSESTKYMCSILDDYRVKNFKKFVDSNEDLYSISVIFDIADYLVGNYLNTGMIWQIIEQDILEYEIANQQ